MKNRGPRFGYRLYICVFQFLHVSACQKYAGCIDYCKEGKVSGSANHPYNTTKLIVHTSLVNGSRAAPLAYPIAL